MAKWFFIFITFLPTITAQAQWVNTNEPYAGTVNTLAVVGTDLLAGTNGGGIFRSSNDGFTWTAVDSGVTNHFVTAFAVSGSNLLAVGTRGNLYVWINQWVIPGTGVSNPNVTALAISGSNLFAGTTLHGVFLSTDDGYDWTSANTGLPSTNISIYSFLATGTNLFAGTDSGVFLSTNNGTSWFAYNTGLQRFYSIYALALSDTNLFAGTYFYGVYLSTNNGTSWTNTGLYGNKVDAFAVSGTKLIAGTSGGVYLSTNNGTNWTAVDSGLTNTNVTALAIIGANIFAGTGNGVWRRPLSEMITTSVGTSQNNLPTQFNLEQNYPNPFNPTTTISYSLPHESYVRLSIFNTLGQNVRTLVNQFEEAGNKSVSFDAGSLSSGVYFYRLQAGTFSNVKKLLLIK